MSDLIYAFQRDAFQADAFYNVETLGQFVTLLQRGGEQRCILVEMDYIYESTDSPTAPATGTLYFSDREFFDDVTNHPYVDVVRAAPQYTRALSGDNLGVYVSSVGSLELDNADGELDFVLSLAVDGSHIRFYYGGIDWLVADFKHIFTAIVSKATAPSFDRISVALKDTGLLLDKSIGGTTTVGGTGPNADRSRPANIGYIHNLAALISDQTIGGGQYVHSDSGTLTAAVEVRDRGVSVYYTDNADGTFDLLAPPAGIVTCDVLAEPNGAGNVRVSNVLFFLVGQRAGLDALGLYDGPGRTYTTEDQDDYKLGISLAEARNVIDLLQELVVSANCFWAVKRLGAFTFGRLRLNDIASFNLAEVNIYEDDIDQGSFRLEHAAPQYYKFQAYMSRNWTRQTDFASSLTPDEQATYSRPGLFVVQPDSVGTTYANAPELYHKTLVVSPVIDTLLSEVFSFSDVDSLAQWETTRRAIFLPWIEIITIVVGVEFYSLELGDPVRLFIEPRMGEDDTGVLFQVISNTIRLTDAKVELKIARRNIIQAIPPSWTRLVTQIDDSQFEYKPAPPAVQTIDLTQEVTPDARVSAIDSTGKWRFVYVKPRAFVHPDVLLWVPFRGGSQQDISSYRRAPTTTITGGSATFIDGFLYINRTDAVGGSTTAQVSYLIEPLPFGGTIQSTDPITCEGFVKWVISPNNAGPFDIFQFNPHPSGPSDIRRFLAYAELGDVEYNDSGFGVEAGPTTSHPLAPASTLYHWAWTFPAGAGVTTEHFYINGVEVLSYATSGRPGGVTSNAAWIIGGLVATNGAAPNHTEAYLGETRVTRRDLYPNGTSFTPPTPGNLSVIS